MEAHQTVSHLKALIATAIKGVELPFELQQHGVKESDAYDDNDALSDAGLVSGSVVSVPAELVEIFFILPRGLCNVSNKYRQTDFERMHFCV